MIGTPKVVLITWGRYAIAGERTRQPIGTVLCYYGSGNSEYVHFYFLAGRVAPNSTELAFPNHH